MINMPETKTTLLVFPLFVMFMITLISIGSFSGNATLDLYDTRTITDYQVSLFDNYIQDTYDVYGENPNEKTDGGDWSGSEAWDFVTVLTALQDSEFGNDDKHNGHIGISFVMLKAMRDVYNENAVRVDENDVKSVIEIDPISFIEWQELNAGSIRLGDVLVFVGIFVGVAVLIGILGIRVFGIGIADASIKLILQTTLFLLLWTLLSIFAYGELSGIPILGPTMWIVLTFMYMGGAVLTITGSD